jgi:hypothetical protein
MARTKASAPEAAKILASMAKAGNKKKAKKKASSKTRKPKKELSGVKKNRLINSELGRKVENYKQKIIEARMNFKLNGKNLSKADAKRANITLRRVDSHTQVVSQCDVTLMRKLQKKSMTERKPRKAPSTAHLKEWNAFRKKHKGMKISKISEMYRKRTSA